MFSSAGSGEEDNRDTETTAVALPLAPPQPTSGDVKEATPTPRHETEPTEQLPMNDLQGSDGVDGHSVGDVTPSPLKSGEANEAEGEGGETPPTPQATDQPSQKRSTDNCSETAVHSVHAEGAVERGCDKSKMVESCAQSDNGEEGNLGAGGVQESKANGVETEIEAVTGIGLGTANDNIKRQEALSPPAPAPMDKLTGLIGIDEVSKKRLLRVQ